MLNLADHTNGITNGEPATQSRAYQQVTRLDVRSVLYMFQVETSGNTGTLRYEP